MKLPHWAPNLRPHQLTAIQEILDKFSQGYPLVFLDAPTGSGKTLIAEMVRQELKARALYLCSSLNLQDQFAKDFPYAAILSGRSNYPTYDHYNTYPNISAADCNKQRSQLTACVNCGLDESTSTTTLHCYWCHPVITCPYEKAKAQAIRSELVCTNSYYFLYEANYVGNLPIARKLVIIDEADTIETIILSFISVHITKRQADKYNINPPERKTVESAWIDWAIASERTVKEYLQSENCRGNTIERIRNKIRAEHLYADIQRLNNDRTGLKAGGWIYTGYDKGEIEFKPVKVDDVAGSVLWQHCDRWLLMSATMISFQAMAECLGVEKWEVVSNEG